MLLAAGLGVHGEMEFCVTGLAGLENASPGAEPRPSAPGALPVVGGGGGLGLEEFRWPLCASVLSSVNGGAIVLASAS